MTETASLRRFILERLAEALDELDLDAENVPDAFELVGSGAIDSMDFVNLIGEIETEFDIEIDLSEHEPEEFTTLGGLVRCAAAGTAGTEP